jgi:hypothetical protein
LLSAALNLTLLSLIVYVQYDMLMSVPLRGYVGMLCLVLASLAAGWLLAGSAANRSAMMMATAVRNVGVGLVIVTSTFAGTRAVAATTAFALFQTVVLALCAVAWGRLARAAKTPPQGLPQPENQGVAGSLMNH